MSFLGNPPSPAPSDEPAITNDGWFPNISAQDFRKVARGVDGTATVERLRHSLIAAILSVNSELAVWKAARQAEGRTSLADVPGPQIGGTTAPVAHYLRAVYAETQADLAERMRGFDTTGAGDKRADAVECIPDTYRQDKRWAISDLLGIGRSTVELI